MAIIKRNRGTYRFQVRVRGSDSNWITRCFKTRYEAGLFETEVKSEKATVMTRVVKYPGWKLFVDGNEREVRAKDGKIIVEMGKGKHIVKLVFENTWLRIVANLLSLLTLGLVGVILVKSVKYKNRE